MNYLDPVLYIEISAMLLVVITILIVIFKGKVLESKKHKKKIFLLMIVPVILSTLYLAGATIYENSISQTKGPIHWHMDYKVIVCGERQDLVNPTGLKNKIGSPLFHEHNDDRIHVEGSVMNISDISLGKFFEVLGGKLESGNLIYPTEDKGIVDVKNGDKCSDGTTGILKVYINGKKVDNYYEYVYYPDAYVPPGDCVIIKFDSDNSATTDELCESWEVSGWDYQNYVSKRPKIEMYGHSWEGYD